MFLVLVPPSIINGGISKPFTFQEQIRLAEELVAAHQRVASIVVTNSPLNHRAIRKQRLQVKSLHALRSISCEGDGREFISDILGILV